jgi:hypothetical protein
LPDDREGELRRDRGTNALGIIICSVAALVGTGSVVYLVTADDTTSASKALDSGVNVTAPVGRSTPSVAVPIPKLIVRPGPSQPTDQSISTVEQPASTTTAVVPPPTVPFVAPALFSATQSGDVIAQVAEARGASPLRILTAAFYPDYAFVDVQDPGIPANSDTFEWRGSVKSPKPTLIVPGDFEAHLFSDTDVNWAAIPGLVDAATGLLPVEGGKVSHVLVQRNLPFSDEVLIFVYVDGTRSGGLIQSDTQGNVIRVLTD